MVKEGRVATWLNRWTGERKKEEDKKKGRRKKGDREKKWRKKDL